MKDLKRGPNKSALMVDARDKKKKFGMKHNLNIKCFYCEERGNIQSMSKSNERPKEFEEENSGEV